MTISEIAKQAGVSSAAVSRYLNNGYLSEEKRAAIQKVIEKTGYKPSAQAQNLRTKKTKLIGVVLPRIDSSSIGRIVSGIQNVIEEKGYQLLLANAQNNPDKELKYLEIFDDKRVDGIIFIATIITSEHKRILKKTNVPLVIVGQQLSGFQCVYHDDYNALKEITELMIDSGKQHIGYIGTLPQDVAVGKERYRGYCDAVKERNLNLLAENYIICDSTMESGYEAAQELLQKEKQLDGIVCATDRIAVGALQYLKEKQFVIPEQMAITGHGDSVMCKVADPMLTTIHYYYEDSGIQAAEILMQKIINGESPMGSIKMGYSIEKKSSL